MAKATTNYCDPLDLERGADWQPVAGMEGMVEQLTLSIDEATGECTRLTRFLPGADTAARGGVRRDHPAQTLVLAGRLHDAAGSAWLEPGHHASHPAGEVHGPYRSDEGCVVLEVSFTGAARG